MKPSFANCGRSIVSQASQTCSLEQKRAEAEALPAAESATETLGFVETDSDAAGAEGATMVPGDAQEEPDQTVAY